MIKKSLTESQMSDVAYIEQAVNWSKDLTRMRTRGPGDLENAMRAIERDYGVDYWFLWQLRYTPERIKKISVSIYTRIHAAHEAERDRQARLYQHELAITKATAGAAEALIRKAVAVAGEEGEG